jgi:hypothetical protein
MEGTSLEDWVRGFRWQPRGATTGAGLTLVHAPSGDEWQVVHCEGDLSGVADLLRGHEMGRTRYRTEVVEVIVLGGASATTDRQSEIEQFHHFLSRTLAA